MPIGKDIARAQEALEAGLLVAIPTETVYGLAANALDPMAVASIFRAKNRPEFDPLIVHASSAGAARAFVTEWPDWAEALANAFWPGPLTLLLPRGPMIPDLVTSGLPRVALRVPRHPLTLELLQRLDFPLAAPSANPFGYVSPTLPEHVAAQLGEQVAYILDGAGAEVGIESTIMGMEEGVLTVYRLGGLSLEAIREVVGDVALRSHSSSHPAAPGMLHSHYAPLKPFYVGDIPEMLARHGQAGSATLSFSKAYEGQRNEVLSPEGDDRIAAAQLFARMRALDADPSVERILAELVPEDGLGRAINDRLRRAAVKRTHT